MFDGILNFLPDQLGNAMLKQTIAERKKTEDKRM
jgi:hypothetical protein